MMFTLLGRLISLRSWWLFAGLSLNRDWPLAVGCFFWRGATRDRFLAEIRESLQAESPESLILASGLLGVDREKSHWDIIALEAEIASTGWDPVFTRERTGNTA